jgi:predicted DNA-binding ribbon-helix-helix protein
MDKNKYASTRIHESTLDRIRKMAKLRNTTIVRLIDEMALDYEMDLRSLTDIRTVKYIKDGKEE